MTGHYIPFTAEQLAQMRNLYSQGYSAYQIAGRYGICRGAVVKRLKIMGVPVRVRGKGGHRKTLRAGH